MRCVKPQKALSSVWYIVKANKHSIKLRNLECTSLRKNPGLLATYCPIPVRRGNSSYSSLTGP
jgi:hypothetical protein